MQSERPSKRLTGIIMKTIKANTINRSYEILIEPHFLSSIGSILSRRFQPQKILIVTDTVVEKLYLSEVSASLKEEGFEIHTCILPVGEKNKNFLSLMKIVDCLSEFHFDRADMVIALGGGVVSDTAALAASLFLRGIKLVIIPTTLLASVDAAIGGKTGINLETGKNRIGSFYQPHLVIISPDFLQSLPKDEIENGIAEIIKYSFLSDEDLIALLHYSIYPSDLSSPEEYSHQNIDFKYRLNPVFLADLIHACATIKVNIIENDENDLGIRRLLNFGHTIGHAIEKKSDYQIPHGKAVATGMFLISRASVANGLCNASVLLKLKEELELYSLPYETDFALEELMPYILDDKKKQSDLFSLICVRNNEKADIVSISGDELYEFLKKGGME